MKKALLGTLIVLLVLSFNLCKSPQSPEEILPRAILEISMQYEPVVFVYDYWYRQWCLKNCVILIETNGVGGNINFFKAEMMYQGAVWETINLAEDCDFDPYESISGCAFGCTIYEYDKMKITVQGIDNNGYNINASRTFDVYYE